MKVSYNISCLESETVFITLAKTRKFVKLFPHGLWNSNSKNLKKVSSFELVLNSTFFN